MYCSLCGEKMEPIPTADFVKNGTLWFCMKERRVTRAFTSIMFNTLKVFDLSSEENSEEETDILYEWVKENR